FSASNRSSLQTIESDALSIEQIVSNLIDNAIKYAAPDSSPPVVELTISQNQSETSISVRDYGPGLTKKQLARLFEPFSKAASEAATSAPGIGLGLALCKRLARSINGDIRHESPAGRGARFVLSLRKMS
ncbi:MAG: ATP-binding protein, partial [Verrucomicrobiota bacterium]